MRLRRLRRLRSTIVVSGLVIGLAAAALHPAHATPAAGSALCGTLGKPPSTYTHVIWIWLENHAYEQVVGAPGSKQAAKMPYLNGTLIPSCGLATNYHSISHPSLPNYIAATSGSTNGITRSCSPSKCPVGAVSLFEQVSTWRSYDESMPSNCYPSDSGLYPADHNPAVYYTRIASECASWDVPSGTTSSGRLASDLAANTLPAFAFVVPNTCNSTETCAPATGDAWLQAWITKLVGSTAYRGGKTVIFVTWDEGNGGTAGEDCLATLKDTSCHVATVVLSPYTKPGTTSSALFSHYSLLSTTEQLLGLPSLRTASSSSTQTMRSAFHL